VPEKKIEDDQLLHRSFWKQLQASRQLGRRVSLGLIFVLALTFFLHFREVGMEMLEIGTLAPRYVIAQIDFDFPDSEATQVLKQEAVRDIGVIYKIDEAQVVAYRNQLEASLIKHQKWRNELPKSTFDDIYNALEAVEEELIQVRFSDERTLRKMQDLHLKSGDFYLFEPPEDKNAISSLPSSFWSHVEKELNSGQTFQEESLYFIIQKFSHEEWRFHQDYFLERIVRQVVQEQVPKKYTHVEAGSQIVLRNETVTVRHVAMLQAMKQALAESRNLWTPLTLFGSALLAVCLTIASLIYLRIFHREITRSLQKLTLLVVIILLTLVLAKGTEYFLLYKGKNLIEMARFPLLVPFAAMLITVLLGSELALFAALFLTVVLGFMLPLDNAFFLVINLFAALATILFARSLHKRKEVFTVCSKVWLSCIPLFIAFNCIDNSLLNINVLIDVASGFIFMMGTALFAIGLLPILESLFCIMTDMTLMEYMDPNNELLRRLSLEAPGTYQHCLVVGNLAEAAARAIGANGLFCRVSTLYHDIGKLFNPHYFTENQLGGFNIHQLLTPLESTQVIIAHVAEGEALARKYRLPQSFIDIVREHHGTTMVYYFYCKQVEQMNGDATKVNEKLFRYPGPKPRSKESAIIMLADTVEAASRSMDEITEELTTDMVEKLVAAKAESGQFDDCQLTFEELGMVKKAMVKALIVTRHLRVKYPEHGHSNKP
jgi:putative nucleotidyltransferase with HDIG domain